MGVLGSPRRLAGIVLLVLAGLYAAYGIVAGSLSSAALARGDLVSALSFRRSSAVLAPGAQILLRYGRYREAQAIAIRTLKRAPHDAASLRALGQALRAQGDAAAADQAMILAARVGWRDSGTQLWVLDKGLETGDAAAAAQAADALLRRRVEEDSVLARLERLIETQAGREALAERIVAAPPWRALFFEHFQPETEGQRATFAELLVAIDEKGGWPRDGEVPAFFRDMLAHGAVDHMIALWRQFNPRASGDPRVDVVDGDFEQIAASIGARGPFGWRIRPRPGISVGTVPRVEAGNEPALRVESYQADPGAVVTQLLALPPGDYRLAFTTQLVRGDGGAFDVAIRCGKSKGRVTSIPLDGASAAWSTQSLSFTVYARGCESQTLALRVLGDEGDGAVMLFDSFALSAASR